MNDHKKLAIRALQNMIGDDLFRARAAFSLYDEKQMQEQHGASGKTRAQIVRDYEDRDAKVNAAIEWVSAQ